MVSSVSGIQLQEYWYSFDRTCFPVMESSPDSEIQGTLFFLHGRIMDGSVWLPIIRDLRKSFRCLFLDFPGFGSSYNFNGNGLTLWQRIRIVSHLLDDLDLESVVLVGHDVGGAIAQICAVTHPDRVAGLVLMNCECPMNELHPITSGWRGWGLRRKLMRMMDYSGAMPFEEKRKIAELCSESSSLWKMLSAFDAIESSWPDDRQREVWRRAIGTFTKPAMVLWGGLDRFNPPEHAFELVRRLPDAWFFQSENCGHWPCLEEPEWVTSKMRDFLFRVFPHQRSINLAQKSL